MSKPTEEIHDVLCTLESPKAILVVLDRDNPKKSRKLWIPKSVIDDDSEVFNARDDGKGPGTLIVHRWFAEKEGLG